MIVNWLPQAQAALVEQTKWLEENRGHKVVARYFEQVNAAIERLRRGDTVLYRLYDKQRNIRYCHVNQNTLLYYRILDNSIELMTFFNTRQDPGKLRI